VDAALPIGLAIAIVVALFVLVEGLLRRRTLLRQLDAAWLEVPRDEATGLFDTRVCLQRVAAEVKRARRGGGSVWVVVVTVLDGDADRFGRILFDSMRLPEVGFRLSDQVVVIARPNVDPSVRADVLGRVAAAAPRERLAIGEATWSSAEDGNAADLLRRASDAVREVTVA